MTKQVEFIMDEIKLSEVTVRFINKSIAAAVESIKDNATSLTVERSGNVQRIQSYINAIQEADLELQAEMKKQDMLRYMLTIEEE